MPDTSDAAVISSRRFNPSPYISRSALTSSSAVARMWIRKRGNLLYQCLNTCRRVVVLLHFLWHYAISSIAGAKELKCAPQTFRRVIPKCTSQPVGAGEELCGVGTPCAVASPCSRECLPSLAGATQASPPLRKGAPSLPGPRLQSVPGAENSAVLPLQTYQGAGIGGLCGSTGSLGLTPVESLVEDLPAGRFA